MWDSLRMLSVAVPFRCEEAEVRDAEAEAEAVRNHRSHCDRDYPHYRSFQ